MPHVTLRVIDGPAPRGSSFADQGAPRDDARVLIAGTEPNGDTWLCGTCGSLLVIDAPRERLVGISAVQCGKCAAWNAAPWPGGDGAPTDADGER
ncbi:MAG TPA: hypothetical protein VMA83_06950 [Solirubrobacteraceae bacterium]|nr:hypothetical protein [Solirubrobacteraceae bacterium]